MVLGFVAEGLAAGGVDDCRGAVLGSAGAADGCRGVVLGGAGGWTVTASSGMVGQGSAW